MVPDSLNRSSGRLGGGTRKSEPQAAGFGRSDLEKSGLSGCGGIFDGIAVLWWRSLFWGGGGNIYRTFKEIILKVRQLVNLDEREVAIS
jgi:hypothetical protein